MSKSREMLRANDTYPKQEEECVYDVIDHKVMTWIRGFSLFLRRNMEISQC